MSFKPYHTPEPTVNLGPDPQTIRECRQAHGLTQEQAAELVWSTLRTWQNWEAGINKMHPAIWWAWKEKARRRYPIPDNHPPGEPST